MTSDNDIIFWLALNDKRGLIPHYLIDIIISKFDDLKKFWYSSKKEMVNVGLKSKDADYFINYINNINLDKYKDILQYVRKNNIKIIKYIDDEYPSMLKLSGTETHEPPILLFRKGLKMNFIKSVAIVGTREASDYAKEKTREFSRDLAIERYWIISGMALGIDHEAHSGALEVKGGKTIAVLPWMVPVTPANHKELSEYIVHNGCILSEILHRPRAPPGSNIIKYPFITRNRITSGLSDFVIAVESGPSGGTIRQIDFARAQHKDVYTLYPELGSPQNIVDGFNLMIKKGAKPIKKIKDINLKLYEQVRKNTKLYMSKIDPSSFRLSYGYNIEDAINRFLTNSQIVIDRNTIEIIPLENHVDNYKFELKYYLIHSHDWQAERPACPKCGSRYVVSRGRQWHCGNCGRYFTKQRQFNKPKSRKNLDQI